MSEYSFRPPSVDPKASEAARQVWAEHVIQRPKALQELPLVLVPPYVLNSKAEDWQTMPTIQSAIQAWLNEAHQDDERLCIERRLIPHTPIYIPDTPEGQQFFQLAKAIADIPLNAPIVPKNQNQGLWFKTLHYYWQARGVVIAQRLLRVIPDPLGETCALQNRLSTKNLDYLHLSSTVDIACFQLLTHGELYIKQWANENQISYSFETPRDLLLKLLSEDFLISWQLGPDNQEQEAISKAQQRDNVAIRVRLLKQFPWLADTGKRPEYGVTEQEYLQYLRQAGWSGYWILALRPYRHDQQIEPHWEAYVQALGAGKELAVATLDWFNGQPFHRPMSNPYQAVEATLDLLGYIHWT